MTERTMFDKIWQRHVVVDRPDGYTLLYVDRHLMHDGSSPAYARLKKRGMGLRRPDRAAATPDHYVKTDHRSKDVPDPDHRRLLNDITTNCNEAGVTLHLSGAEILLGGTVENLEDDLRANIGWKIFLSSIGFD